MTSTLNSPIVHEQFNTLNEIFEMNMTVKTIKTTKAVANINATKRGRVLAGGIGRLV